MALLMAMLMLVLIGLLGIAVINLSSTDIKTAAYEKVSMKAFMSAESALTQVRNDMQSYIAAPPNNGQWPALDSTVINGIMNGQQEISYNTTTPSGEIISFSYTISDFGAPDDRTVLVTVKGQSQNLERHIEAIIQYEPAEQVGAQECYNSKCTNMDQNSGASVTYTGSPNSTINL